jgi:hypothetical protein
MENVILQFKYRIEQPGETLGEPTISAVIAS